jgi:hypothetical protein
MPKCKKHPKFEIVHHVYYRSADINNPRHWVPNNEGAREQFYKATSTGDPDAMAVVFGEAMLVHSNETSADSAFVSVAKCPACLAESTDPTIRRLLEANKVLLRFEIPSRNESGSPFIFEIAGEGIGAGETEGLVLLPEGESLLKYHQGYVTMSYVGTLM